MRTLWLVLLLLTLAAAACAQPGIEAYDRGDLDAVRAYLTSGKAADDEADFLRAALTTDADSAVERYRQVVLKYPESPLTRRALDRIHQYYFAKGLYTKADEVEKSIRDNNTRTPQPAATDTASKPSPPPEKPKVVLDKPINDTVHVKSPQPDTTTLAKKAEVPAKEAGRTQKQSSANEKPSSTGFVLQLGAFANPDNVRKLKESLEKAGYTVEISPTIIGGKHLQAVRAVGFKDKNAALAAIPDMKKKYGLNPVLLPPGK